MLKSCALALANVDNITNNHPATLRTFNFLIFIYSFDLLLPIHYDQGLFTIPGFWFMIFSGKRSVSLSGVNVKVSSTAPVAEYTTWVVRTVPLNSGSTDSRRISNQRKPRPANSR